MRLVIEGATVKGITEKPVLRHLVNAGMYLLNPEVRKLVPSDQASTMPDLVERLVAEGYRVISFPVAEYWLDIGQHAEYQQAQEDVRNW